MSGLSLSWPSASLRLILFSAILALAPLCNVSDVAAGSSPWGQGYLPNVPVVTQDGKTINFYDDALKGKIVIISFIYTSCRDICPVVTARLSQLEEKLGDVAGRDIFFVSVSIDPVVDTPAKLKEYSQAFQAGPGWLFLTGKPSDMEAIRFKLGERRELISQHRNEILLYNDATGDWERSSVFGDLNTLVNTVRRMDPAWRDPAVLVQGAKAMTAAFGESQKVPTDASGAPAIGLPGEALFIKTCASCHTIGRGERVGPDLVGVTSRRERAWVSSFIANPGKTRSENSPASRELAARYRMVQMPNLGLSDVDVGDVIAYIEAMTYGIEADRKMPQAEHHHHHGAHKH